MFNELIPNELLSDNMRINLHSCYNDVLHGNVTLSLNLISCRVAVLKFKDCKLISESWFIATVEELNFKYRLSFYHNTGNILTIDEMEAIINQAMEICAKTGTTANQVVKSLLTKKSNALDKGE